MQGTTPAKLLSQPQTLPAMSKSLDYSVPSALIVATDTQRVMHAAFEGKTNKAEKHLRSVLKNEAAKGSKLQFVSAEFVIHSTGTGRMRFQVSYCGTVFEVTIRPTFIDPWNKLAGVKIRRPAAHGGNDNPEQHNARQALATLIETALQTTCAG